MNQPDTILAHPALAGRTLMVLREGQWAAHVILPEGCLGEPSHFDIDPSEQSWRGRKAA